MGATKDTGKPIKDLRRKDTALIRVRRQAMERRLARGTSLSAKQMRMLSFLSKAQRDHFLSYSPVKQARIMEEIEKKLARREEMADEDVIPERPFSFDISAYEDMPLKKGSSRIQRKDPDLTLRRITQADIRAKRMRLRADPDGKMAKDKPPVSDKGVKHITQIRMMDGKRRGAAADRMKSPARAMRAGVRKHGQASLPGGVMKAASAGKTWKEREKSNSERKPASPASGAYKDALMPKNANAASDAANMAGSRAVILSGMEDQRNREAMRRKEGAGGSGDGPGSEDTYYRTGTRLDNNRAKSAADTILGTDPKIRAENVKEDTYVDKIRAQAAPFRRGDDRYRREKMPSEETDRKELAKAMRLRNVPGEKSGEEITAGEGISPGPAFFDAGSRKLYGKLREKEETSRMAETKEEYDTVDFPLSYEEGGSDLPKAGIASDAVFREVAHKEKEEKKEAFLSPFESSDSYERKRTGNTSGSTDRRKRRRQEKYRKRFVMELVAIIEKDMAKDQGIRQAQRSGQIRSSVSELTDHERRGSIRIAAIPLRLSLKMMTKRLREELKRRLKESAAVLLKYAMAFGAPVMIILLVIMLLSGILMVGITQESSTGTGLGWQIVQEAKKHLGLPYVYGGTSLENGCDCSGFVWAIYNLFGYNLPRTAGDQYAYGRKVGSDVSDWQPGDLIYYSRTGSVQSGGGRAEHIVIYIGGGQVISCGPVAIYNWDYRSDYYGTCRIIPDEAGGGDFSGSTNEEICWNYFISQGFSRAATAGILGNMYVESGGTFDPSIHQYGGGPGRGLCQWEESYSGGSGRYNNLVAFANGIGKNWDDIEAQLQFVCYELNSGAMNPYFSAFGGVESFKNLADPVTAAYVFLCGFEYCGDPGIAYMESNFSLSTRTSHASWAFAAYI